MSIPVSAPSLNVTPLGPGRLVLVVGPSGAGKDTLITGVRTACRDNPSIVFPRRVVTRASSGSEEHDTLEAEAFDNAVQQGAFSFWWEAHGLKYGFTKALDDDISAGRTAVCNVSRTVVTNIRARYEHVTVVLVTAPPTILAERLIGRARTTDGSISDRLQRNNAFDNFHADIVIENIGAAELATGSLLAVVDS